MAFGDQIGEFSYQLTSVNIDDDGTGQQVHTSTWDGEASGYGTVLGTMTLYASASDEAGRMEWNASAYLDSGDRATGTGTGTWSNCGKHQWRIRAVNLTSTGSVFGSDGVIDLQARSFKGSLFEWE